MFLEGIKVLDVGSYVAAPAAATVMSDFGADVIKIEPIEGDPYRQLLGLITTEYPNFAWDQDSRNKRSLSLDVTSIEGREILICLIEQSDVVITNYRPELLDRFSLTYDDVKTIRPNVIYGQVNAFGLEGPDVNRTGFDATAWWARSGLMDYVKRPDQAPGVSSPAMGDHATCMSLFGGIMGALYRREKTGQGAHVHTSLMANGVWSHSMMVQGALAGYDTTGQRTAEDIKRAPLATMYNSADDKVLLLCILNPDKEWTKLLEAIDRPDLGDDPRFAERQERMLHGPELYDILAAAFAADTADNWCQKLDAQGITYAFSHTLSDVVNDSQAYASDILTPVPEGRQLYAFTVNSPVWLADDEKRVPGVAPEIGEHTVEILTELGLSRGQVEQLLANGVARSTEVDD